MGSFRVLIVDDSAVFRSQIKSALSVIDGVEVVNVAANGKIALERMQQSQIDLITLDLEMPEMDGLETLREIKRQNFKVKVIVFSSQSQGGAKATMQALSLGAVDFVPKPGLSGSGSTGVDAIRSQLNARVVEFMNQADPTDETRYERIKPVEVRKENWPMVNLDLFRPKVIVIASSTGGPGALEKIFQSLKRPIRCPILIGQHMPPLFTASLAERLSQISGLTVKEGVHGEKLSNDRVYIAPGDFHMSLASVDGEIQIQLDQGPQRNSVRPCADFLFESAAQLFGRSCMGVVLTGMGEDGKAGAIAVKSAGGPVMIQNQESCVVFGMPGAVHASGAFDVCENLENLSVRLARYSQGVF